MSQPAKVLIIDDSAVARQTLKNILSEDPELEAVSYTHLTLPTNREV